MARKREFDKDKVLEQAMILFWRRGYEATSIHDLKKAMNISTSSMYETFGDKRGIFLEALARFCDLERKQLSELARESSSVTLLIERLFDSVELVAGNNENYGSLAFNAMIEFGTRDATVTDLIFTHYGHIAEIVAEVIADSQTKGHISSQYEPLNLSHLILSILHGVVTIKRAQPGYTYTEPIKQIILSLLKF